MQNAWTRILSALEMKINRQSFQTWLKPTRFSHVSGRTLFVRIPSVQFQHIGDRYADLIQEAIDHQALEVDDVRFVTVEDDPSAPKTRENGGFAPVPSHSPNAPQGASQHRVPSSTAAHQRRRQPRSRRALTGIQRPS